MLLTFLNRLWLVVNFTVWEERRVGKDVEKDAALARRFQEIYVAEPSVEDTISILRGIKIINAMFHSVTCHILYILLVNRTVSTERQPS